MAKKKESSGVFAIAAGEVLGEVVVKAVEGITELAESLQKFVALSNPALMLQHQFAVENLHASMGKLFEPIETEWIGIINALNEAITGLQDPMSQLTPVFQEAGKQVRTFIQAVSELLGINTGNKTLAARKPEAVNSLDDLGKQFRLAALEQQGTQNEILPVIGEDVKQMKETLKGIFEFAKSAWDWNYKVGKITNPVYGLYDIYQQMKGLQYNK